jgi:uncharacterized repeat protein (TIGR01451 family)
MKVLAIVLAITLVLVAPVRRASGQTGTVLKISGSGVVTNYTPPLSVQYSISVKNKGPSDATNVVVSANLQIGQIYYVSVPQGSYSVTQNGTSNAQITCYLGTVPAYSNPGFITVAGQVSSDIPANHPNMTICGSWAGVQADNSSGDGTQICVFYQASGSCTPTPANPNPC